MVRTIQVHSTVPLPRENLVATGSGPTFDARHTMTA